MKKTILLFAMGLVVYSAASLPVVYGQGNKVKKEEITAAEKKEASGVAERFMQQMDEKGDVEPLIKEMFVDDFTERYVKEELQDLPKNRTSSQNLDFNALFRYDSRLLEIANDDDWRRFYISSFNFLNSMFAYLGNKQAELKEAGKDLDDLDDEKLFKEMFPASVSKILQSNPKLTIHRNEFAYMETIGEFRSVATTLADANKELRFTARSSDFIINENGRKALESINVHETDNGTEVRLDVCKVECFGFPKGTRLLNAYIRPIYSFVIIKIKNEYKIVAAGYVIGD